MGEPQPSGVSEPSEILDPFGVLEESGALEVPEPSKALGVPQPPGVPEPSKALGVPQPPGVPEPSKALGVPEPSKALGVSQPPGVLEPSKASGVPQPSVVPDPSGVPQPPVVPAPPGVLQPTPPPEVLAEVLRQRFGPLPRPAPIVRLRRGPAGAFEPTEEPAEALERRQAANAKERERIRNINRAFSRLRSLVPLLPRHCRPSKARILRAASEYIRLLRGMLQDCQELDTKQELGDTAGVSPGGPLETWPGSAPPMPVGTP